MEEISRKPLSGENLKLKKWAVNFLQITFISMKSQMNLNISSQKKVNSERLIFIKRQI